MKGSFQGHKKPTVVYSSNILSFMQNVCIANIIELLKLYSLAFNYTLTVIWCVKTWLHVQLLHARIAGNSKVMHAKISHATIA